MAGTGVALRVPNEVGRQTHRIANWHWAYVLVPVVVALIVSANTLKDGFAFDDNEQVLRNELIKEVRNLPLVFTSSVWSFKENAISPAPVDPYYRPLFMTLFMANYLLFGTSAWAWHLVSVLIHAGVTLLVFFVIKEATDKERLAGLAAVIFAVHPAHVESVAWVSGVTDPLMAVFALLAFYYYLTYRKNGRKRLLAYALLFYLAALMSKETAAVEPLLILVCELFYFEDESPLGARLLRSLRLAAWFLLPAAIYLAMRYQAIGSQLGGGGERLGLVPVMLTIPLVIVKYLRLLFVPVGYSLQHHTAPVTSMLTLSFAAPLALIVVAAAGVLLAKSRSLTFAVGWFLVWLLPPLAGVRVFETAYLVQERYLYLPSIGICLVLALGLEWLAARELFGVRGRIAAAFVTLAMVLTFGIVTVEQNRVWNDSLSLFRHSVATDPRSPVAHTELASEYFARGMRREAEEECRAALDIDPHWLDAYIHLSQFSYKAGKLNQAIDYLNRAESMMPEGPLRRAYEARIRSDRGFLFKERKDYERAEEDLRRSVELLPIPKSWYELADLYFERGRYQEALDLYEKTAAAANQKFAPIHLKLGRAYERLGRPDLAKAAYEKYLDLSPPTAEERREAIRRLSQLGAP